MRRDHREADLTAADREMLDFVVKVTHEAYKTQPADLDRLRGVGFDDRAILQITLIAAWFNYINRVPSTRCVGRPDPLS
ncbi:MAG: hypothetical protein U0797_16190 [Gemmataceae bacterium]